MNVEIASGLVAAMQDHARAEHPREACGLLLGTAGRVGSAVPARNVAERPHRTFEIDPATLLRVHREARGDGEQLLGWYHSHPNGVAHPSPTDAARAVEDGKLWVIVTCDGITAWTAAAAGLHGRFTAVAVSIA